MPMNIPPRPGRNDPCWCGSGKKYKQCHLAADQAADSARSGRASLLVRLQEFALQRRFEHALRDARGFFSGPESRDDPEDEEQALFDMERTLDYFIHDYRLEDDRRVIELFDEEEGKHLTADERSVLDGWLHSRLAAYEAIEVRTDGTLRLRDLVSAEEFEVVEREAVEHVNRWDIVFTRVLFGGRYTLSGIGVNIPPRYRDWVRSYAEELWDEYRVRHEDESYEDFLHASAQLLNQFILREIEPAMNQLPTLVTAEGDLMELCRAIFDVVDYPLALAALRGAGEFQESEADEGDEIEFAWNEVGESYNLLQEHGQEFTRRGDPPANGRRILGHILLREEELELETQSERRLAAGKELLEKHLGSAIRYVEDEIVPFEEALADLSESALQTEEELEELPEEVEEWHAELLAQDHLAWLDRPVPALGDKTPRQAVETLGGRVQVIRLLKEFESLESQRAHFGGIPFSWDEIKRELGLQESEFVNESQLEDTLADEIEEIERLADEDQPAQALNRWRALCNRHRIRSAGDLEFSEVVDLYEYFHETMILLVDRLAAQKRYDQAIAFTEELIAFDPDRADSWRAESAMIRIDRGEVEAGTHELQELAARNPEDMEIVTTLARVQRDVLQKPGDALPTLTTLLPLAHDDVQFYDIASEMMDILTEAGRFDEAERLWHKQNDSLPEPEQNHEDWIELQLHRGRVDAARKAIPRIANREVRAYWTGAVLAAEGQYDAARRELKRFIREPRQAEWPFWIEWTELHLRLHDADRILTRIAPDMPGFGADGYFYLALAFGVKNDLARAAAMARRAQQVLDEDYRPTDAPELRRNILLLAREIGLSDEAIKAIGL